MLKLAGVAASRGFAIGPLYYFDNTERKVELRTAQNPEAEMARFEVARLEAIRTLEELYCRARAEVGDEDSMIFEIHALLLNDPEYLESVTNLIRDARYTAEYAAQRAGERFAEIFAAMDDPYMRERSTDMLDISARVVRLLRGEAARDLSHVEGEFVLAAQRLLPSEMIQLDRKRVLGIITCTGSRVSHASILARTMGIPCVVGVGNRLSALKNGDTVIVDGFSGAAVVNPDRETVTEFSRRNAEYEAYLVRLKQLKGTESRTLDGTQTQVLACISRPSDVPLALENDAQGIGLLRSEFLYLEGNDYPDEQTQFQAYRDVLVQMGGRLVTVRTLCLGAGKEAPYFGLPQEENPALGCRAIRLSLSRRGIFKTQLRALLRASVYGRLAVAFPMIVSMEELTEVKQIYEICRAELRAESLNFDPFLELGVIIDTPAAVMLCDQLAREADFFAISAEDLTQYTLAADRSNAGVSGVYNPAHPSVLRMMRIAAAGAAEAGIRCSVWGEAAANQNLTQTFLAMGITEFSVEPTAILEVRGKIRSIRLGGEAFTAKV